MKSDADQQLDALFRAARAETRDTARAEFAFETRLMARLGEERGSSIGVWAWRLAPLCAALAVAAGLWSRTTVARVDADAKIIAEASRRDEERVLMAFMTGEQR